MTSLKSKFICGIVFSSFLFFTSVVSAALTLSTLFPDHYSKEPVIIVMTNTGISSVFLNNTTPWRIEDGVVSRVNYFVRFGDNYDGRLRIS